MSVSECDGIIPEVREIGSRLEHVTANSLAKLLENIFSYLKREHRKRTDFCSSITTLPFHTVLKVVQEPSPSLHGK